MEIIDAKALVVGAKARYMDKDHQEMREALDMAIVALLKQKPMKITETRVDEYFCPKCGSENNCDQGIVYDKYCPECGQKLKCD